MKNLIKVSGIKLYCFHGCLEEETRIGGHYRVNVILQMDFSLAAENDDLSKTIDYVMVNEIVESEMKIPAKLIEHVGQRIYSKLKSALSNCLNLEVEIVKFSPPINGDVDSVAIVISDFD